MREIWSVMLKTQGRDKFLLPVGEVLSVSLPRAAEVLSVGDSGGCQFVVWALVEPSAPLRERRFVVYGTGDRIACDPVRFVGSVRILEFVWHVFEVLDRVPAGGE